MTYADNLATEYKDEVMPLAGPLPTGNTIDVLFELQKFDFTVLKTGLPYFDDRKLFIRGAITRIGAMSSIGKSTFAYWIAYHLLKQGRRGMIFSTEVPRPILLAHLLRLSAGYGFEDLMHHRIQPSVKDLIPFAYLDLHDNQTFENRLALIREEIARFRPEFVVIDFIQDIRSSEMGGNDSLYDRLTKYAFEIQKMAQEFAVTIIDFSQISNLDAKSLKGQRGMSRLNHINFKGSGDLFSSADVAIVLDRYTPFDVKDTSDPDEVQEELDFTEFRIGVKKHKYSTAGTFKLSVDLKTGVFEDPHAGVVVKDKATGWDVVEQELGIIDNS